MSNNDLIRMIKSCIRSHMGTFGLEIHDMTDLQAMARLGSGSTTVALKIEFDHCTGGRVKTARLRKALDAMHFKGLLLKSSGIGHMNTYWPVGFADEIRDAALQYKGD